VKNIFAPPPTKTIAFEVKNRRKSAEEVTAEHLLTLLLLSSNKTRLDAKTLDKVVTVGGSNNASNQEASLHGNVYSFFQKNLAHFGLNFSLKTLF